MSEWEEWFKKCILCLCTGRDQQCWCERVCIPREFISLEDAKMVHFRTQPCYQKKWVPVKP